MLEKLYHYGVRGIAHELISSYLSNRKQFVYHDSECYSAVKDINVGVPQRCGGISIWGSDGSISNLGCLFSAQKKCIRSLFRVKRISVMCPGHTKSTFTTYKILTVHNLYFYSALTSIFSSLYSCPPQPIVDQVKPHLSKRKEAYLILPLVRLSNHHKNMPYVRLWNSFINITSTLDLLAASLLLYWKLSKFKMFAKDTLLYFQSLNNNFTILIYWNLKLVF